MFQAYKPNLDVGSCRAGVVYRRADAIGVNRIDWLSGLVIPLANIDSLLVWRAISDG